MKLLIISGPFFPKLGNNGNLILKTAHCLAGKHEIRILSYVGNTEEKACPTEIEGIPVYGKAKEKNSFGLITKARLKIEDPKGYSDAPAVWAIERSLKKIYKEYRFEAILTTSEPFYAGAAVKNWRKSKKILYIMDPPAILLDAKETAYRKRLLGKILDSQDGILTTSFIKKAMIQHGMHAPAAKTKETGFPMITSGKRHKDSENSAFYMDPGRINLLFSGWLYSDIRSPEYFLKLISVLDERFCIYFMGRECSLLRKRFSFETKAEVITLGQQPYETALAAMEMADVLVNIGNSVPVHMPSKTLEYINTGKPIVNIYKMKDCPTLYYTERYPDCLNIFEDPDRLEENRALLIDFCMTSRERHVDHDFILKQYHDCTVEYCAEMINEILNSVDK